MNFSESTGRGVRIAVIDSGVHAGHPHVQGVTRTVAIGRDGASGDDVLGHGTAVLACIKEKAPDADFTAIRVYYESLRTSVDVLAEAIRWALANNTHIINLSLGTVNLAHIDRMTALVAEANAQGVVLVSAADADSQPALPGSLPGVLGTSVDWECPRDHFRQHNGVWLASGYPRPLPGVPVRRNLYGVSFAVASMTAFAARAWQTLAEDGHRPCNTEIEALLTDEALA